MNLTVFPRSSGGQLAELSPAVDAAGQTRLWSVAFLPSQNACSMRRPSAAYSLFALFHAVSQIMPILIGLAFIRLSSASLCILFVKYWASHDADTPIEPTSNSSNSAKQLKAVPFVEAASKQSPDMPLSSCHNTEMIDLTSVSPEHSTLSYTHLMALTALKISAVPVGRNFISPLY